MSAAYFLFLSHHAQYQRLVLEWNLRGWLDEYCQVQLTAGFAINLIVGNFAGCKEWRRAL